MRTCKCLLFKVTRFKVHDLISSVTVSIPLPNSSIVTTLYLKQRHILYDTFYVLLFDITSDIGVDQRERTFFRAMLVCAEHSHL